MTPADLSNLLLSIAYAMAQAAAPGSVTLGTNLFVHQSAGVADPVATLRIYGAPGIGELRPIPGLSVQCMTLATDAGAGLALANRLYATLYGSDERPRHDWLVAGKRMAPGSGEIEDDPDAPLEGWDVRLVVPAAGGPGIVGRDASGGGGGGRWEISFNFDVRYSQPS